MTKRCFQRNNTLEISMISAMIFLKLTWFKKAILYTMPSIINRGMARSNSGDLTADKYKVRDYVNGVDLGEVTKGDPQLITKFENSLLIEAYPVK